MDSATLLDRALFQLTPTRTRFDLVVFSKGKNEKLASGLFEPFISHLKFARDQISKGGYSISLQPPAPGASWFTKATFERFVCFVSTPVVLERFVSIEREILQIERSVQANELNANGDGRQEEEDAKGNTRKSIDLKKVNGELKTKDDIIQEENSKVQLQRLLETRKALLRKEQAMTYARGLVAGFEMENMEDLISFADAFGASRLREACINFKELCKKKHADRLWMEELAAVEACSPSELPLLGTSGIVLANRISILNPSIMSSFPIDGASNGDNAPNESSEASKPDPTCPGAVDCKKDENLPASDQKASATTEYQVPMQWPNQIPQHMYGLQGQLPPYQGYPFHPMQPVPLPYPLNMQWPPNRNQKSSSRKKKNSPNGKGLEYSGEERQTESSGSDSGSDSSSDVEQEDRRLSSSDPPHRKKNRKKSSRTVVIRNINYITPKRRSGEKGQVSDGSYSGEDDLTETDSFKQKVDDAVKSLKESRELNLSNDKRRGADKSHHSANKSNDSSHQGDSSNDLDISTSEGGKRNGNWEALQNLLMRDEENASVNEVEWKQAEDAQEHFMARNFDGEISATSPSLNLESQKIPIQRKVLDDSFVMTERDGNNENRVKLDDFNNGDNYRAGINRGDSEEVELLRPERLEDSGNKLGNLLSACANESAAIRSRKVEDWYVGNLSIKPENRDSANNQMSFNGDHVLSVESDPSYSRKDVLIDDSFMVAAWPAGDEQDDSQWKTDISVVADLTSPSKPHGSIDASQKANKVLDSHESNDLCMVLERNPGYESSRDSWTMDYQIDLSFTESNRSAGKECDDVKVPSDHMKTIAKHNGDLGQKKPAKEARSKVFNGSLVKSKAENISKSKKPTPVSRSAIQKSKLEKEEDSRKKMEELLIERQKRIAERTAAAGYASAVCKKAPLESKAAKSSIKADKNKNLTTAQATNRVSSVKTRAT